MNTTPTIIKERLAQLPELRLNKGAHNDFEEGHCAMEVVAWLAGEGHTDAPECASSVLRTFVIGLNDAWSDVGRQRLAPYLPRMVGTAGDGQDKTRSYLALDWLIRTHTPAVLDLAGLTAEAQALSDLRRIADLVSAKEAGPVVKNARGEAYAAAARAAAGRASRVRSRRSARAAFDAAYAAAAAAVDAADAADAVDAVDAAYAAAFDAANAANAVAAPEKLAPTVEMLQASALDLLDRMINPKAQG